MKSRFHILLLVTIVILAVVLAFVVFSFMRIMKEEANVKVYHFRFKISDLWAVGFTLKSPKGGFYRYSISHNSTAGIFSYSNIGYIEPPNSFTYTLNVKPETNTTIAVNIRVWWGEQLIDEVNHYTRADD